MTAGQQFGLGRLVGDSGGRGCRSADGGADHDRAAAAVEEDAGIAGREEFPAQVLRSRESLIVSALTLLSITKKMPPPPSRALLPRMTVPSMRTL